MAAQYHSLFTTQGLALLREAIQSGTKLGITHMAYGDGNGIVPTPNADFTKLVKEVYRTPLNRLAPSKDNQNWLEADGVIPSAVGGFNIREVGLYAGNVLVAYANYPATYKPSADQGTAQIKTIRIVLQIDNTANFELKIDASVVMATVQYVEEQVDKRSTLNLRPYSAVGHFDISTRNGVPESQSLKDYFSEAENKQFSSVDLALDRYDYLIDETIVVQEPITVFGRAGTTYGRGKDKKGSIVVASGLGTGFDLGNYRTWKYQQGDDWIKSDSNPADQWVFNHVRIQAQDISETNLSQTAFKHTSATDGPDRGMHFVGVSARGFDKVIHFIDNGGLTQAASVNIEACVLSNNKNVVVADNTVYGLRFVNNQAEQCKDSIIKGKFSAGILIQNNMMEGNYNAIDLKSNLRVGYNAQIHVAQNYFEWNKGDFVMSFEGAGPWDTLFPQITIEPNFAYEILTMDYARFSGRSLVKYNDYNKATAMYGFDGVFGSHLINDKSKSFLVRKDTNKGFSASISQNIRDIPIDGISNDYISYTVDSNKFIKINGQNYRYIENYMKNYEGFKPITEKFSVGDIVEIHFLMCDILTNKKIKSHFAIGAYDDKNGDVVFQTISVGATKSNGQMTVISAVCQVSKELSNPIFRFFSTEDYEIEGKLLGFTYKNHKILQSNTLEIVPKLPLVNTVDLNKLIYKKSFNLSIQKGAVNEFDISINDPFFIVQPSNFITIAITSTEAYLVEYSAMIKSQNIVKIKVKNISDTDILNTDFKINIEIRS